MMETAKFKICPVCSKKNLPNLFECKYCEADLTGVKVEDETTPHDPGSSENGNNDGTEAESTGLVRICDCGAKNAPQSRKCTVCGEDISDIIPTKDKKTDKKTLSYELRSTDGSFSVMIDKPLIIVGRESELKEYLQTKIYVSRQHAKFTVAADKVFIENLSKTNGTFLNNRELPDGVPTALDNGDEIGLGGKLVKGERQSSAAYFIFQVKS